MVKFWTIFFICVVALSSFSSVAAENFQTNLIIKQKIKEAGCSFAAVSQLLERNVCLIPEYASNELPQNSKGVTDVNLYLLHAFVLEVEESKNKLTVELLQYLEWNEPRIRANFSASPNQNKIRLLAKNINRIWHPDLDIYTKDLKEWKSLYDPVLYQELHLSNGLNQTSIIISALKSWKATIFCKFDFSLFPFDTQRCVFLQFGNSQNLRISSNCRRNPSREKFKPDGFDVSLTSIGSFCDDPEASESATDKPWMDTGFNITLKRHITPYLYQYYFPSIAIVVVSFISFIIPLSAIPGRIVLVVTQFLTLTNIFIHQMVRISNYTMNVQLIAI